MKLQSILSPLRKADQEYHLIEDGDKIAVALSGGKDSMLLFLTLSMYQKFPGKNFELCGIHVDVGFEDFDHQLMRDFCSEHNLDLHIEKTKIFDILKLPQHARKNAGIDCSLCSTLKKGVLFEKAKELGCNKVAFGHHGDDAVETLMMNLIYGGKAAVFRVDQYMSRLNMHAIRPLVYCREDQIVSVCELNNIPSVRRVCPNDGFTKRQEMKELLQEIYEKYPTARDNILKALSNQEQVLLWQPDRNQN